ncbi:inner membrane protein ydgC [Yersinia pestis PY-42]|nr:inner membrane protein ydgC [Yersinia pestis PY-19]EIR91685.1 inner membrane protein ydgC [Yersinia pestis PY-42]EIS43622.1 inner membrane protein ydgC [Yersinia pestis PY-58]EIS57130.1 inner membrane protein ydgC [Yersinia pestis PY-61]EIT46519.1 inner membrane protein ydgC [Yersinia pestis PY-100]EIT65575.1 inner membrane protein ydgC [Yersinia pestis PY-113]
MLLKVLIGTGMVLMIALLSKTRHYYIAGLIPLFPTFALITHYIVGTERSIDALRITIKFGLWAIIPYFIYLISLYFFIEHMRLSLALISAVLCWVIAAWILISIWSQWHSQ